MKYQMRILQGVKLAAVLAVALAMGACAKNNVTDGAMASAATPGSQQDFVVNVGDRVFFESDQTELSPQAIATLEKQAPHDARAAQRHRAPGTYHPQRLHAPLEGSECPAARYRSEPHAHHLLRQGASGGGL